MDLFVGVAINAIVDAMLTTLAWYRDRGRSRSKIDAGRPTT